MPVPIENVVSTKRDNVTRRKDMMSATLHQPSDIEIIGI